MGTTITTDGALISISAFRMGNFPAARDRVRKLSVLLLVVVALSFARYAQAQTFDDAVTAYDEYDYDRAIEIWQGLAQQGHVLSQFNLGLMYETGVGVPVRYDLAFFWYRMAALNGHDDAKYNLGGLYFRGQGVEQSVEQAMRWWEESANAGNPNSAYNLGVLTLSQTADEATVQEAMIRLKQAADAGHPEAASLLADLSKDIELPDSLFFSLPPEVPAIEELMTERQPVPVPPVAPEPSKPADSAGQRAPSPRTHYGDDAASALAIGRGWIELQSDKRYTVKVYEFYEPEVALWYLKKWGFGGPGAIYRHDGEFNLVLGSFDSRKGARGFLNRLREHVPEVQNKNQQVVKFDDIKDEVRHGG
jgi:hypothetical protein